MNIRLDGHLYDKEAILEYIVKKKAENARKTKEYERLKERDSLEMRELAEAEQKAKADKFLANDKSIMKQETTTTTTSSSSSVSNMAAGRDKDMPSFWVPALTPSSSKTKDLQQPPDQKVYCPMSGNPLRIKDLVEVKFIPVDKNLSREELITKDARYVCAVSGDVLSNSIPCAVLKTSGSVVTMECVEKFIKKDMIDPTNEKKLKDRDIIPMVRGGTGFAETNQLSAKVEMPAMQA